MGLAAGFQSVDITCPVGARLGGYAAREHCSEGIAHPLRAKALVLSNGLTMAALVTCDLLSIDPALVARVRERAARELGIPADNVMVTASHTHSGPAACRRSGPGGLPQELTEAEHAYFINLCEVVSGAVVAAGRKLRPVRLGVATGSLAGAAANRVDPSRPIDDAVTVLVLRAADGGPGGACELRSDLPGVIVNFTCHPTVLDHRNYLITGDYPSFTQTFIEQIYPGSTAMFLQGAAGDVSTRHTRRASDFSEARRIGEMLGAAAVALCCRASFSEDETLGGLRVSLKLPPREFPPDDEIQLMVDRAREEVRKAQESHAPANVLRTAQVTLQGAERMMRLKGLLGGKEVAVEVQVLRLGPLVIAGIPGELFNELGSDIKRSAKDFTVVVGGYANDYVGYLVPREFYDMPSYEAAVTVVGRGAAEAVAEAAKRLIGQITSAG